MYKAGTRLMHATHGLGVVESVESKEMLGQTLDMATVHFPEQDMRMMVNLDKEILFRPLIKAGQEKKILEALRRASGEGPARSTWRKRVNLEKLKSNDVYQVVEVIKNLALIIHRRKKLNQNEVAVLEKAQRQLASEISAVTGRGFEEVLNDVEKASVALPESKAS